MSRTIYLVVTLCWMSSRPADDGLRAGFAGVPAQEAPGLPGRGFLGFPAGGVGGFAGGHTYGMHAVGMPGRNEFDTLYPVTLPNLGAAVVSNRTVCHPWASTATSIPVDFPAWVVTLDSTP